MAEEVPDTQRTTSPAELRLPQGIELHGAATVMPCEPKIYYTRARSSGESLLRFQLSFVQREREGEGRGESVVRTGSEAQMYLSSVILPARAREKRRRVRCGGGGVRRGRSGGIEDVGSGEGHAWG